MADTKASEDTAQKAEEARKLIAEIGQLQAVSKAEAHKPKSAAGDKNATNWLAERIIRLEMEQQTARSHITQLAEAKKRLEEAARKSKEQISKAQQAANAKLQKELDVLIKNRQSEFDKIKAQIHDIREKADQDAVGIKAERDAARIIAQEHQEAGQAQLAVPTKQKKLKKILLMTGGVVGGLIVVAALLLLFIDKIPFLHRMVAKSPPPVVATTSTEVDNQEEVNDAQNVPEDTEVVPTGEEDTGLVSNAPLKAKKVFRDKLRDGGVGPIMVKVPDGSFLLGTKPSNPFPDELPQVLVDLQGFSISRYEVTVAEYQAFAKATGREMPGKYWEGEKMPIVNVSWHDAVEYTEWLSTQTGRQYRLPSEREWEYAASSGIKAKFPWGEELGKNKANCASCYSRWDNKQPAPVGSFEPNHLGLYDVIGNVAEWTAACYHPSYKDTPTTVQLWGGGNCAKRMIRGGSFRTYLNVIRLTKRKAYNPKARSDELGFRVARAN